MNYKKIVISGGGILGSQIAFQTAYCGYDVTILIRKEDSIDELKDKIKKLLDTYKKTIELMNSKAGKVDSNWARGIASKEDFKKEDCLKKAKTAINRITIETDQSKALKDADLLIESITENFDIKSSFYKEISTILPEKTVVVTNSSTLLPSKLAKFTGRPNKYLSLHFANSIWKNNIAEVMRHSGTDIKYFNEIIAFAESINMIPLAAKEEKSGYLLNSMLVPFLLSAMDLLANGISDPETIDKAWTLGTGAPKGPFQIIDTVGLETAKNIVIQYQKVPNLFDPLLKKMMLPYNYDGMLKILNDYIEQGKIGKSAGEGFYKYNK
ncbi:MAG: 3-hydroxyacyl-CoA dehydrogenase [Bacilli bacterium]|nr:3-hydroxyacyl-CoA dehydrogenase [Bacilli bacterium]